MALPLAIGATATTAATAAYLNAKFHLLKDLNTLRILSSGTKSFRKALVEKKASLFYFLEEVCQQNPDSQLIWSREGSYSRKEVLQRAYQYGNYFLSLGVQPGEMVALYHTNAPEYVLMWFGLWSIGAAPALINYNLAAEALVHCVKISGAKVMIVDQDDACRARVEGSMPVLEKELGVQAIVLSEELKAKIAAFDDSTPSETLRQAVNHPHHPTGLFYTSGTTGLPKAFPIEVSRIYPLLTSKGVRFEMEPGKDMWYDCMPLYHGTGGLLAINSILRGIAVAIGKRFSTSSFWKDVRDSGSTAFVYVGETPRYLLSNPPSPDDKNHNIRLMHGNGMRPDVWTKFQERFGVAEVGEFFNSTEGVFGTFIWSRSGYGAGTVGHQGLILRLLTHNRFVPVAIDPQTGEMWRDAKTGFAKRVKYSEGGEIIVKMNDPAEWPGYFRSEGDTQKRFCRNVFKKGDIYYRPGDALRRDDDGLWYFMDRLGDTFRWKGENVSTAEVSDVLGHFDGIQEANVYGVTLPNHDGRAGCVALALGSEDRRRFNWRELVAYSRAKLPAYAVPVFIRVVGGGSASMGTHNNKQNKVPLRDEGVDPALRGTKVPGGSDDAVYWLPPQGEAYIPFTKADWEAVEGRTVKL